MQVRMLSALGDNGLGFEMGAAGFQHRPVSWTMVGSTGTAQLIL